MDYGRALKICRAALELNQQDVAKRAGITNSYLSLVEGGKRSPSLATLEKICKAMRVPPHLVMLLAAGPQDIPGPEREKLGEVAKSLLQLLTSRPSRKKFTL
jgi:transcriptional regulator with XRE-family HTH domain